MAVSDLPSTPVDGMVSTMWVPAIADTTAPKLTEINAAGSVDLSCYLTTNADLGGDQATIPDPRACSLQDFEAPGKVTRTASLTYINNPQATGGTNNKAATTLVPGTGGYLVFRRGLAFDVAYAVGQKVDVWPVACGLQIDAAESGQVLRITQKQFVRGPVRQGVATVA